MLLKGENYKDEHTIFSEWMIPGTLMAHALRLICAISDSGEYIIPHADCVVRNQFSRMRAVGSLRVGKVRNL